MTTERPQITLTLGVTREQFAALTGHMPQVTLTVPLFSGEFKEIPLPPGAPLYIVGANGTGKSALVQYSVAHLGAKLGMENVRRISAHRQTWMTSGRIAFTPYQRRDFDQRYRAQESHPQFRWQDNNAEGQLQSVLFDLTSNANAQARRISELAYNRDYDSIDKIVDTERSVFERLNALLAQGCLPVSIANSKGEEIIAHNKTTGASYSIAQMSDGERNAVIIAANVLTVESGTVLIIDEPERHLHHAITEPFLSALFAERPDCPFVISTHEVGLPLSASGSRVLMLYQCRWDGEQSSAWDAELLEPDAELPEDLKRAILGARKAILFVEGQTQSLDQRLYSLLFPKVAVIATGSCNDVIRAVGGLQQTARNHNINPFGLIDRDDRNEGEVEKLADKGIYALDAYSVESLYYCSDSIDAVAQRQAITYGIDAEEMSQEAKGKALNALSGEDVAMSMAERLCNRNIEAQLIRKFRDERETTKDNTDGKIILELDAPYQAEMEQFHALLVAKDFDAIVARYPVRHSGLPRGIAMALRHGTPDYYMQALLVAVRDDESLADKLRQRMAPLVEAIQAHLQSQA